ncbi:MAG TPA: prevent-host-death protein [Firmicutes bacterium]|nr:prevent-host-death protein [Bacillota bacterium]
MSETSIIIRPVTELTKNAKEIEQICLEDSLPVFLTKNGSNHMVIMSHDYYEQQQAQIALLQKLLKQTLDARNGKTHNVRDVLERIQNKIEERFNEDGGEKKLRG